MEKFKEYLNKITQSKFTISSIMSDIRIFLKEYNTITTANAQDFVFSQMTSGKDSKTVSRRFGSLKHYAKFNNVVLGDVKLPKTQRRVDKITVMSEKELQEIRKFIDSIDNTSSFELMRLKVVLILLSLGLRRTEITELCIENIDFSTGTISFVGKGGKGARISMYSRDQDIKSYIFKRNSLNPTCTNLIVHKYGTSRRSKEFQYKEIAYRELYKILYEFTNDLLGKRVNPHTFRHTLATILLDNHSDLRLVQDVLRHTSIVTTQIYTHVSTERIKNEVEKHHPIFN